MAESRVFKLMNGVTLEMLGEAVEGFLRDSKGMQTQAGQTTGGYLIQGRQEADGWKRISGTDQAISVHNSLSHEGVQCSGILGQHQQRYLSENRERYTLHT